MRLLCLLRGHEWRRGAARSVSPHRFQECRTCGRTRLWNRTDGVWLHGDFRGLPDDALRQLSGEETGSWEAEAAGAVARYQSISFTFGGGSLSVAGGVVAALGLLIAMVVPDPLARFVLGTPVVIAGLALLLWRSGVEIDAGERVLVSWVGLPLPV